jgi:eukaryotic-like serine/threonine-protein kinase
LLLTQPAARPPIEDPDDPTGVARIGQRVGAYRIAALIGRGGMGHVYQAERADAGYKQQGAVRFVHAGLGSAARARFQAERQIGASLDHPNLVKLIDGGVAADGTPYLVMEPIDGLTIDRHVREQQLGVRQVLTLMRSLCAVVHYVHCRAVVHRDLKPGNVLVSAQGQVKLLDFGIAKLQPLDGEPVASSAAPTRQIALTPEYCSAEQIRGEAVTPSSDVYALGVLLYRLLTGVSPYGDVANDMFMLDARSYDDATIIVGHELIWALGQLWPSHPWTPMPRRAPLPRRSLEPCSSCFDTDKSPTTMSGVKLSTAQSAAHRVSTPHRLATSASAVTPACNSCSSMTP